MVYHLYLLRLLVPEKFTRLAVHPYVTIDKMEKPVNIHEEVVAILFTIRTLLKYN